MFEVTASHFYAATKTSVPLIDGVVNSALLQTGSLGNQTSLQIVQVWDHRLVHSLLQYTPDLIVQRVEVRAIWWPQV